jgi:DNA-binding LytR/AlgR family response regulator
VAEPKNETEQPKELTAAQAAKLVKREVPVMEKGKPTGKMRQVAISVDKVLTFKDYSTYVVVVTTDGQKLRGDK